MKPNLSNEKWLWRNSFNKNDNTCSVPISFTLHHYLNSLQEYS